MIRAGDMTPTKTGALRDIVVGDVRSPVDAGVVLSAARLAQPESPLAETARRLRRNKTGMLGTIVVALLVVTAAFADRRSRHVQDDPPVLGPLSIATSLRMTTS